jgi:hypothetical protein
MREVSKGGSKGNEWSTQSDNIYALHDRARVDRIDRRVLRVVDAEQSGRELHTHAQIVRSELQ